MVTKHFTVDINTTRCKGCGLCIAVCPHELFIMDSIFNAKNYPVVCLDDGKTETCSGCLRCVIVCPDVAITLYRKDQHKEATETHQN